MIKRRTLSELFGGQVWNTVGAFFPLVRHMPHQLTVKNALLWPPLRQ